MAFGSVSMLSYEIKLQVAKQLLEEINIKRRASSQSPISWKDAVKFCMARKFNKTRALELYFSHEVRSY